MFTVVVEPIGDGLAANLGHPGGNLTGVTTFDPQQATAQLEFLRAVNPGLERVAMTSGLPSATDAALQRSELARSAKARNRCRDSRAREPVGVRGKRSREHR